MPIDIPTKTDASIGRPLTDRPRQFPPNLNHDVPAAVFERLKDAVIEAAGAIHALETARRDDALWRWNRVDLSQFESSSSTFADTLGLAGSGAVAIRVDPVGWRGMPVLELEATALRGGHVFLLAPGEVTLPRSYIIRCHLVGISASGLGAVLATFGQDDAGSYRGALIQRTGGGSFVQQNVTTAGPAGMTLRATGLNSVEATQATWSERAEDRGGLVLTVECFRPDGATPSTWAQRYLSEDAANADRGAVASSDATGPAATSPDWDGRDLDRIGLGLLSDSAARDGVVRVLRLSIERHPAEVP